MKLWVMQVYRQATKLKPLPKSKLKEFQRVINQQHERLRTGKRQPIDYDYHQTTRFGYRRDKSWF